MPWLKSILKSVFDNFPDLQLLKQIRHVVFDDLFT